MAQQLQQPSTQQGQQRYGGQTQQHYQKRGRSLGTSAQGSQQFDQPSAGGMGQQGGAGPVGQVGQQLAQRFEDSVPGEVRLLVEDLDTVANVAEWTKGRAAQRGMPRVIRICDDIEDIAHLEKKLVLRESPFAEPIGQATYQTIEQGLQELQQYVSEPEVQEAIQKAQQTLQTIEKGLNMLQGIGQQGQQGQQGQMDQQFGQPQQQPVGQGQQFGQY